MGDLLFRALPFFCRAKRYFNMQNPGKSALFKKSLPLIVCELSDAMMLFTGVIFLSMQDEVYLAAIGLIDALLLCCLAYGHALSDAFQNFYARRRVHSSHGSLSGKVLRKSCLDFTIAAIVSVGLLSVVLMCINSFYSNEIISILFASLPFIGAVVLIYYLALAFHSYLIGKGHLQQVGYAAIAGFLVQLLLVYLFLHHLDTDLLPTNAVLLATAIAEVVWLAWLYLTYRMYGYHKVARVRNLNTARIRHILRRASILPGLSVLSFHVLVSLTFLYLTWCCAHAEVATLTLAMSYYTLLIAPANGISAAAANGFSQIHISKRADLFPRFRKNVFTISLASAFMVFTLFIIIRLFGLEVGPWSWEMMAVIGVLATFAMRNKIDFAAVLVRLRVNFFIRVQMAYATMVFMGFVLLQGLAVTHVLALLVVVLLAQAAMSVALEYRMRSIWL